MRGIYWTSLSPSLSLAAAPRAATTPSTSAGAADRWRWSTGRPAAADDTPGSRSPTSPTPPTSPSPTEAAAAAAALRAAGAVPAYGTMAYHLLDADVRKALGPPEHFSALMKSQWDACPTGGYCSGHFAWECDLCLDAAARAALDRDPDSEPDSPGAADPLIPLPPPANPPAAAAAAAAAAVAPAAADGPATPVAATAGAAQAPSASGGSPAAAQSAGDGGVGGATPDGSAGDAVADGSAAAGSPLPASPQVSAAAAPAAAADAPAAAGPDPPPAPGAGSADGSADGGGAGSGDASGSSADAAGSGFGSTRSGWVRQALPAPSAFTADPARKYCLYTHGQGMRAADGRRVCALFLRSFNAGTPFLYL